MAENAKEYYIRVTADQLKVISDTLKAEVSEATPSLFTTYVATDEFDKLIKNKLQTVEDELDEKYDTVISDKFALYQQTADQLIYNKIDEILHQMFPSTNPDDDGNRDDTELPEPVPGDSEGLSSFDKDGVKSELESQEETGTAGADDSE